MEGAPRYVGVRVCAPREREGGERAGERGSSGLRVGGSQIEGAKVVGATAVRDTVDEDSREGCRQHESQVVPRTLLDPVGEVEAPRSLLRRRPHALAQPHPRGDLPIISAVDAECEAHLGGSKLDDGHACAKVGDVHPRRHGERAATDSERRQRHAAKGVVAGASAGASAGELEACGEASVAFEGRHRTEATSWARVQHEGGVEGGGGRGWVIERR